MKKLSLILVLVLVVIILFIVGKSNKTEAPIMNQESEQEAVVNEEISNESKEETKEEVVGEVKEFIVTGKNFSFDPSIITVKKGDKVKIVFKNTQGFHDFVIDEYGAATKKDQAPFEEIIEFTADKAGSFEYYCSVGSHRTMGMKGTLVVNP